MLGKWKIIISKYDAEELAQNPLLQDEPNIELFIDGSLYSSFKNQSSTNAEIINLGALQIKADNVVYAEKVLEKV